MFFGEGGEDEMEEIPNDESQQNKDEGEELEEVMPESFGFVVPGTDEERQEIDAEPELEEHKEEPN